MWVLLALSIIAIYILGKKWWMIRKAGKIDGNFMREIRSLMHDGKTRSAISLCGRYDSKQRFAMSMLSSNPRAMC